MPQLLAHVESKHRVVALALPGNGSREEGHGGSCEGEGELHSELAAVVRSLIHSVR